MFVFFSLLFPAFSARFPPWQVDFLGHFLLTELLLPALRAATNARVVVVSSGAHSDACEVAGWPKDCALGVLKKNIVFLFVGLVDLFLLFQFGCLFVCSVLFELFHDFHVKLFFSLQLWFVFWIWALCGVLVVFRFVVHLNLF